MIATNDLAPGMLLAAPSLRDPNFIHSVVLLGRSDAEGTLGWVINGSELMSVRELLLSTELVPPEATLPEFPAFYFPVRMGGPVAQSSGWMVYRRESSPLPGEIPVGPSLAVSGEMAAFNAIVAGQGPKDFRMLLGCAGWAPGQLESEISEGAWLPTKVEADLIMDAPLADVWDRAYHLAVGTDPAAFSSQRGRA
jgi:putative transcriptional regulator